MRSTTTHPLSVFTPRKRRQRKKCVRNWKVEKNEQVGENNYPSPKELRKRKIAKKLALEKSAGARQKECMEILNSMDGLDDEQLIRAKEYLNDDQQCRTFVFMNASVRLTWLKDHLTPRPCPPANPTYPSPNPYPCAIPQGHLMTPPCPPTNPTYPSPNPYPRPVPQGHLMTPPCPPTNPTYPSPNPYPRPVPQGHLMPPPCPPPNPTYPSPNPYRCHFMDQNGNPYGAHMAEQTPHYGGYNMQPPYFAVSWKPLGSGGGGNYMGVNHTVFPNANGQPGVGSWSGYGNAYPGRKYGHVY